MAGIFISYRRVDSGGRVGRLSDYFKGYYKRNECFIDIYSLEPGDNFEEKIEKSLQNSIVFLAVVGPDWMTLKDKDNKLLLSKENDFVRREILTALNRENLLIVPVLVGGAKIPSMNDLPPKLRQLFEYQVMEITDERWEYDVGKLLEVIDKELQRFKKSTGIKITCTDTLALGNSSVRMKQPELIAEAGKRYHLNWNKTHFIPLEENKNYKFLIYARNRYLQFKQISLEFECKVNPYEVKNYNLIAPLFLLQEANFYEEG